MREIGGVAKVCVLALLAVLMPSALRAAEPVRLGQIGLSFYAVTAGVVQEVLERLGHTVEVTEGSHAQIFPKLAQGEVDLLVAAWLPHGHAVYWKQYGDRAAQLATLYEGARFAWMVPTYVPEATVRSVEDLRKPEVIARMNPVIQGTGRDSGNMMLSAEVMKAYDLEAAGYRLQAGTIAEFHRAYAQGIANKQWFVMPLWWPHYVDRIGNMRPLIEPKGLLGPPSNGVLVASRAWAERAPERTLRVLRRITLGLDAVAQMDYRVNVDKLSPRDAAREWMQRNAGRVAQWFES
ncbi:MAG TPA: glycine betaine ABC transporter substrate-binding protein [Burkholderiales bacterium]|nr:glycine betaine ABC transporter substrate-binding protein [Burkholderiales bacterium]